MADGANLTRAKSGELGERERETHRKREDSNNFVAEDTALKEERDR